MNNKKNPYTLLLTHDVDRLSLRTYPPYSKIILWFFKRCLYNNLLRTVKKEITVKQYRDSLKWCLLYPFIKLGLMQDPWEKAIYDIVTLEKKYAVFSTFFFIPFPNKQGLINKKKPAPNNRATEYDIQKKKNILRYLVSLGWEIAVHGINAHISLEEAERELNQFRKVVNEKSKIGLRMHWLYNSKELWKNLELAGFYYDASFGSNDKVGFPGKKYKPFKNNNLWIIPLNIQDNTLLSHSKLNLSKKNAWLRIQNVLNNARQENAVVTVLWHSNSFTAPFYWGDIYEKILQKALSEGARVMCCKDFLDSCS